MEVTIKELKIADSFLNAYLGRDLSLIKMMKVSQVLSGVQALLGGKAPLGILISGLQNKHKEDQELFEKRVSELLEFKVEYCGPFFKISEVLDLSPDEISLIDICIE